MDKIVLNIENLHTSYGRIPMLMNVSLNIHRENVCCVLGANGAGKTTLVNTILGIVKANQGTIIFNDQEITNWPSHKRIENGIQVASASVGTFPKMSVETNLQLGAYNISDKKILQDRLEEIYQSFPILKARIKQKAGTLSGGERTMLAIARAVINKPTLLIMDEPSLGLAPIMVEEVFHIVRRLNEEDKMTIMLVEQNATMALSVSKFGYIIQKGQIIFSGSSQELIDSKLMENPVI